MATAPDYLNPEIDDDVSYIQMPVKVATDQNLAGYGYLVEGDHESFEIEIVRWPASGWRPVDEDTGDEGGVKKGTFSSYWNGDILYGKNDAVGGHYILAYSTHPAQANEDHDQPPSKILMWHANYHPDGGQMFYPLDNRPFVVPLALPGDDVKPDDFVCFWFDGSKGLYIHPNIWHEGVFTCSGKQQFYDVQGAVHARVSVNFPGEFGCMLEAPLAMPASDPGK